MNNLFFVIVAVSLAAFSAACNMDMDIVFIIDRSGSIGDDNFNLTKQFVKNVVGNFVVDETGVHVALIAFDDNAAVEFRLTDHLSNSEVSAAVDAVQYTAGGTNFDNALQLVLGDIFASGNGARSTDDAVQVVIFITDGVDNYDQQQVIADADAIRTAGIRLMTVGIGENVDNVALLNITDSTENCFSASDFNQLVSMASTISSRSCDAVTVVDVCAVNERVDCGWPGISRDACLARVGCCFDDSEDDVMWCFKSSNYSEAVCAVNPDDRVECGWPGIPEEVCLSHPQCCFDDSIPDVKWCFHQHDYEYTVRSEVCAIEPEDRVECGWPGILISECLSHVGCCFDDSIPDVLWCFHQKQVDCSVWPTERTDCGWPGISQKECESRGCCFDDTYDETIWCFYKNKVSLPECVEYAPWDRLACGFCEITESECQVKQGRCCYDNTYRNSMFCYKQTDICDVAAEDKEDCGWEGITADRCLARGCCFDDSQDGPWCYIMP
jgi:uncharacterized protein YegL